MIKLPMYVFDGAPMLPKKFRQGRSIMAKYIRAMKRKKELKQQAGDYGYQVDTNNLMRVASVAGAC